MKNRFCYGMFMMVFTISSVCCSEHVKEEDLRDFSYQMGQFEGIRSKRQVMFFLKNRHSMTQEYEQIIQNTQKLIPEQKFTPLYNEGYQKTEINHSQYTAIKLAEKYLESHFSNLQTDEGIVQEFEISKGQLVVNLGIWRGGQDLHKIQENRFTLLKKVPNINLSLIEEEFNKGKKEAAKFLENQLLLRYDDTGSFLTSISKKIFPLKTITEESK